MRTDVRSGFRLTSQALFGLLVIVFGLLLTGDNLGWFEAESVLVYWPFGLVAVGIVKLVQAPGASGRVAGGLLIVVGSLLAAEHVFGWTVSVEDWWPLALVAFGILLITRSTRRSRRDGEPATTEGRLSEFSVWSGKVRRVTSPAFQRADLTAVMGGIELDLRGATAAPAGAVIDVFIMWGGIEISVPPDWAVSNDVLVLMGGAEDHSSGSQDARNRLVVRGFCLMGGIEIKT